MSRENSLEGARQAGERVLLQTFRGALIPASATALAVSTAPAAPWAVVNVPAAMPVAALAWTAGLVSPDSPRSPEGDDTRGRAAVPAPPCGESDGEPHGRPPRLGGTDEKEPWEEPWEGSSQGPSERTGPPRRENPEGRPQHPGQAGRMGPAGGRGGGGRAHQGAGRRGRRGLPAAGRGLPGERTVPQADENPGSARTRRGPR